ncbi:MAG TPA: 6,7-dimethyl-8-ribityllumazine synthase, partial [Chitinophagaceae bacterium]|jgi:6,7-dimethyl-8-ribityllumazine synthase|nr:6,7-dimethyl-8-ribityllumazine synthase [Chitinophagaceae bacterium]
MASVANSKLLSAPEGIQDIRDAFVILIKTEWNAGVVDELERGAVRVLEAQGLRHRTLVVPGAVELPFAIQQFWSYNQTADAFIALGAVVRGDTPHFEYVCQSVTSGITQLNLALPVPVIFGVLTVNSEEQASERIGGRHGHKGEEAALTAIKMILFKEQIKKEG